MLAKSLMYKMFLSGMQAFATIAESPLKIDLSSVLEQVVNELTTFLRKVFFCTSFPLYTVDWFMVFYL
jgi:hypothetical protein